MKNKRTLIIVILLIVAGIVVYFVLRKPKPITCETDADCPEGYECVGGVCVLIKPPPPVFTCPHCGATFSTQALLDAHITKEHPTIPPLKTETLEIDITPVGSGYVVTDPAPLYIENHWKNGDRGKFKYGVRVRVTAHPHEGYEFDHWSDEVEGGTSTSNPEWVADTMTEHRAVKVHFREIAPVETKLLEIKIDPSSVAGTVTVSPSPAGGTTNKWYFPKGTIISVTAHPADGYTFKSWSGEMKDTTAVTAPVYPMTEKRTITAHFKAVELEMLEVKITPLGAGYVTTSPAPEVGTNHFVNGTQGQFKHGTIVYVTGHPSSGYTFKSWSGEMKDTSAVTAPVYPMTEKRTITAHFKMVEVSEKWVYLEQFSVGGHITSKPAPKRSEDKKWWYDYGSRVELTAVADSGYRFKRWSDWSEVEDKHINPAIVYMTENIGSSLRRTVAEFERIEAAPAKLYRVDVASDPFIGGWVVQEPDKPKGYAYGETVRLTAKPTSLLGYKFSYWSVDGHWLDINNPINFLVVAPHTVTAHFRR